MQWAARLGPTQYETTRTPRVIRIIFDDYCVLIKYGAYDIVDCYPAPRGFLNRVKGEPIPALKKLGPN